MKICCSMVLQDVYLDFIVCFYGNCTDMKIRLAMMALLHLCMSFSYLP